MAHRLKLLKILSIGLFAAEGIVLIALLIHLHVQPGHYHLVDIGVTNTLRANGFG